MKTLNLKAYCKRIDELKAVQNKKTGVVLIAVEAWIESNDKAACFADYVNRFLKGCSDDSTIILDDMCLGAYNLYLPTEPLHSLDRTSIKPFVNVFDDAEWLKQYIKVVDANKQQFAEIENAAFQDFLQHYESMSIEEMVECYSNERWFTGNKL